MIPVTLFGYGYWGKILYKEISSSPFFQVENVIDPLINEPDLDNLVCEGVSINQPLKTDGPKVAIIATPASSHFELVRLLLEQNWDVLCEKPLTLRYDQSSQLVSFAESKKRVLAVGQTYLHHPVIIELAQRIPIQESVKKGKLCFVSHRLAPGPIRKDVGCHWDLAIHDISIFLFLIQANPQDEQLKIDFKPYARSSSVLWDFASISIVDPRGNMAQIHCGWSSVQKIRMMQVYGSSKVYFYDEVAEANCFTEGDGVSASENLKIQLEVSKSPISLELEDFYSRIYSRSIHERITEISVLSVRLLEALDNCSTTKGIWFERPLL